VAMNVHGSAVEQRAAREWMPRYHACWSVGGIAGAGCGALAASAGTPLLLHFTAVALACALLVGLALRRFIEDRAEAAAAAGMPQPTGAAVALHPDPPVALHPDPPVALHPDPPESGPPEGERSRQPDVAPAGVHSPDDRPDDRPDHHPEHRPDDRPDHGPEHRPEYRPGHRLGRGRVLTGRLLLVGVVTVCATTLEGAAADWLALFLTDERGASQSLAAAGYGVFAVAMAGGRFSGTAVAERLGRHGAVRAGGLVSLAGVLLCVLGPGLASAYVGAALWALGVCLVFPAAVSAGGETPGRPADAIAAVTAIGYGGFLLGPPLIGMLADRVGLGRALLVLVVLATGIVALAPAVRSRRPEPSPVPVRPG
jgi:MFS transporter